MSATSARMTPPGSPEFDLAEKYLVWIWGSTLEKCCARADFGPATLRVGLRPDVVSTAVSAGIYELRSPAGFAVLTEPYATIFSHLMDRSESEIEDMLRAGIDR